MSYLLVESFSQGLDTRKSPITSKAGTLQVCINAHITRGGEIEKAKAFVPTYDLPDGVTFGLLAVKGNQYVFGSVDISAYVMPQGIAYQRLLHKNGVTAMNGVLHAETFDGKAYVIASFVDGSVFHYYNGVRVTAWDSIAAQTGDNSGVALSFASQIDLTAEFTAAAVGAVVTITAVTQNQPFTVSESTIDGGSYLFGAPPLGPWIPNNDQTISLVKTVSAAIGVSEVWTATIGGTFQVLDTFNISIVIPATSYSESFTVLGASVGTPHFSKTFRDKMYDVARSLLYFSEIGKPNVVNTNVNGSGFINMSNQDGGSEELTALANYQGKMAVFSANNIQIWSMDPDPLKNAQTQVLNNIGTSAPRSVCNFGDVDVFFLADSGIRSIKARDASNSAAVSDVGVYIDNIVLDHVANTDQETVAKSVGIVEPREGRYMLAIGEKIFVYTFFPTPNISAWSVYEPGFIVSDFAYANRVVNARSKDTIYTLGGASGQEYDSSRIQIDMPYLDTGKPAHNKFCTGVDFACENNWQVFTNFDTRNLGAYQNNGIAQGNTYDTGVFSSVGRGTHIGVRLICEEVGYARLSNMAIHYEGGEEDAE